jgi:hypothetical protein
MAKSYSEMVQQGIMEMNRIIKGTRYCVVYPSGGT